MSVGELHGCHCGSLDMCSHRRGRRSAVVQAALQRQKVIDVHCHLHTSGVESFLADDPDFKAQRERDVKFWGPEVATKLGIMIQTLMPKLSTPQERIDDMDAAGIDVQVISPSPGQYYYWAGRDRAAEIVRLCNERIAEVSAGHNGRFVGLGNVSLQHPDLAVEQLTQAVRKYGLKGVEVSSNVNGQELADPALRGFWAKAEELGAVVFIHPLGSSLGQRVAPYYLSNTIGQPLETTIALSMMIFSGLFDEHPELKIVAAHGGGYLGLASGRLDHAHLVREETKGCKHPPSYYLARIWHDTLVYQPRALGHLIDMVGAGQVVLGTDYPFDMADDDPLSLVSGVLGMTEAEAVAVIGGNAAKLFGL